MDNWLKVVLFKQAAITISKYHKNQYRKQRLIFFRRGVFEKGLAYVKCLRKGYFIEKRLGTSDIGYK